MRRYRLIFNPHSGRNRRRPDLPDRLRRWLERERLDGTVVATQAPHHATELARAAVADGCDCVVAVGGDGTMNEVAAGLVGTPVALGLVPCGSGNGLGRHLGLRGGLAAALRTLRDGAVRTIDTGIANGHPFFNAMGAGFDAEISRRFNQLTRRGLPNYVRTGWAAFRTYRPESYELSGDGWRTTESAFVVAVANSDQYGNDARIAPGARVDDGRLDLVAVRPAGLFAAAGLVARLFLGSFDRSPRVLRRSGRDFEIRRAAPGVIHVDGETRPADAAITVSVRPASLRVVVPAAG